MSQGNPFDSFFGGGPSGFGSQFPTTKEEKGVAWHAKEIDGKLYVSLEEVLELLENNKILPKMQERLRARTQPTEG